ncbi:predicted protein [Phaeodactylum tricornutum CCAP 1055/1]|uniref:Uncharacterized protein n=1 Tax=Phaeodactylum tricornutum (strain CCAP 1055/1) TaxID=556484 RepID=B7G7P3_PHATC|nr:predicted protein [Phaeodactylum tricornutum CCAP 1055/1]EEC45269.1 predicted protein [Phaeodactylum tricornutum CCAP 1055/1]|eukprot:XP_002183051.1 predicted protein [Phaeodactylum tricornutum CCAP 1055/1]
MAPRWDKGICLAACLIGLLQSLPRLAYGFYTESLPPRYQHSPSKRPTEQPLRIRRRSSNALNDRINRFTAPGTAIGIAVEPTRDDAPKATYKRNSSRKGDRFAQTSLARNRKRTTLQKTPEQIETQLQCALQQLRIFSQSLPDRDAPIDMLLFPTVRECNAALAAFGDARELLRALRLFGKMRKATALQEHLRERINFAWPVPVPTLQKLLDKSGDTKAIEVYTELMQFLIDGSTNRASTSKYSPESGSKDDNSNTLLLKVFLVFQEMKTAGAEPDVACYNALLRACARAGDFVRAQDVLAQMQATDLSPNDNSWRELLRAAAKIGRSDLAESIWRQALVYGNRRRYTDEPETKWMPTLKSFAALVASYMREAVDSSKAAQMRLFRRAVSLYEAALYGDDDLGMSRLDVNELLDSQRTMLLILQATVALEALIVSDGTDERRELRSTAVSILKLESCQRVQTHRLSWTALEAYDTARKWQV